MSSEDSIKALGLVNEVRKKIQSMRESLQKVVLYRKEEEDVVASTQPNFEKGNFFKQLIELKKMRENHRIIQVSIESERFKIRSGKEKIEKQSVYLAGLEYLHSTITNSIQQCKSIQIERLPFIQNVIQPEEQSVDLLENLKADLEGELKKRQKKNEEKIVITSMHQDEKNRQDAKITQFSTQLAPVITSLAENMKSLNSIFPAMTLIPLVFNSQQHILASQLPHPLYAIYSKFFFLFDSAPSLQASIEIQTSNLNSNTTTRKRQNEIYSSELVITIKEIDFHLQKQLEEFFSTIKINFSKSYFSQIYPIKISIKYIPNQNIIIASLDSKVVKSKEVFSGLFENDAGTLLITSSSDEYEKNLNSQYDNYNWLQTIAGIINQGESTQKVDATQVFKRINERIMSKRIIKFIIELIQQNSIFLSPVLKSSKESVILAEMQKYRFEIKQKLQTSNDLENCFSYQKLKPIWLKRSTEELFDLLQEERNNLRLVDQIINLEQNPNYLKTQFKIPSKINAKLLNINHEQNETECYVVQVSKEESFSATVLLIMPFSTFSEFPKVKISNASVKIACPRVKMVNIFGIEYVKEGKMNGEQGTFTDPNEANQYIPISGVIISQIEGDLMRLGSVIPPHSSNSSGPLNNNNSVGLIYLINRLISLFEITINHYNKSTNIMTKSFSSTFLDILDI